MLLSATQERKEFTLKFQVRAAPFAPVCGSLDPTRLEKCDTLFSWQNALETDSMLLVPFRAWFCHSPETRVFAQA